MLSYSANIRSSLIASFAVFAIGLVSVCYAGQSAIVGGDGGSDFTIKCPKNSFIFGFDIRYGSALDQIKPACAKVKDGKFTDQITKPSWTGGNGGRPAGVFCPGYEGVAGLDVFVDTNMFVRRFNMMCYRPGDGQVHVVASPEVGPPNFNAFAHCPPNQFVNGIVGRSGLYVDAIGVLCADLPQSAAAVQPAPEPQSPQQADQTITVKLDVQVFRKPNEGQTGELRAGDQVVLAECRGDGWCNVRGEKVPEGDGWVYSGNDYNSLGV